MQRKRDLYGPGSESMPLKHIAVLFVLALLRVAFVLIAWEPCTSSDYRSWSMDDDSHQYVKYAEDLLDGSQEEPSVRMPLYPVMLALTWSERTPWIYALVIQQALGMLIGVLCYLTAASSSEKAALPAGVAAMLLPQHVIHSTRIMPDTMALLAVCLSGYLWLKAFRTRSSRRFICIHGTIGLVLSIGAMCKQVLLYSPVVYLALLPFHRRIDRGARFAATLVLLAVFFVLPLSWRHFNRTEFGYDGYSTQDAFEPLGRVAVLAGITDSQSVWDSSFTRGLDSLATTDGVIDLMARDSIYREMTREIVLSEPVRVVLPHLISWPRFFSVGYAHKVLRSVRIAEEGLPLAAVKILLGAGYLYMITMTVLGFASTRARRRMGAVNRLFLGWFLFSAVVYGPLATTRYGLTFFWTMLVTASVATALLLGRRSESGYESESGRRKWNQSPVEHQPVPE